MGDLTERDNSNLPEGLEGRVFTNDQYTVIWRVQVNKSGDAETRVHHLSIKRNDKEPVHDWRDLQAIKTQLLGPEAEAVELYPAESRVVDLANQYHLWCIEGMKWPFGFNDGRQVGTPEMAESIGAKQRPYESE